MPFSDFANPFENPADVPEDYRRHPRLSRLFRSDGSYTRPLEDPVTLWAISILHREYNVPLEAMELETPVDFSEGAHQSGSGRRYMGYVDLVIYDDRYKDARGNLDVAFIALEAMEPGIAPDSEGDDQSGVGHFKRLNAYVSASASARYAILTNGHQTRIFRRDLEYPRALQPIGDLPKYESAAEAARHSPYVVVLNPDKPDGIDTGLVPLTRDKFREVLGDTRSGCHSILRDNEGLQPQEAVDAMSSFCLKGDTRAHAYRTHWQGKTLAVSFMTIAELYLWAYWREWGERRLAGRKIACAHMWLCRMTMNCASSGRASVPSASDRANLSRRRMGGLRRRLCATHCLW